MKRLSSIISLLIVFCVFVPACKKSDSPNITNGMTAMVNGNAFTAVKTTAVVEANGSLTSLIISGYADDSETQSIVITLMNYTSNSAFEGLYPIGYMNASSTQVGFANYRNGIKLTDVTSGSVNMKNSDDGSHQGTFTLSSPTLNLTGTFTAK